MAKVVGKTPPVRDLETVSERVGPLLRDGGRVLMTGATGFVGRWVVGVVLTTRDVVSANGDLLIPELKVAPKLTLWRAPTDNDRSEEHTSELQSH